MGAVAPQSLYKYGPEDPDATDFQGKTWFVWTLAHYGYSFRRCLFLWEHEAWKLPVEDWPEMTVDWHPGR